MPARLHASDTATVSGPGERVTMVTSYVPADPCLPDRSIMKGTWRVSHRSQLYYGWAKYRFASLAARVCPTNCADINVG